MTLELPETTTTTTTNKAEGSEAEEESKKFSIRWGSVKRSFERVPVSTLSVNVPESRTLISSSSSSSIFFNSHQFKKREQQQKKHQLNNNNNNEKDENDDDEGRARRHNFWRSELVSLIESAQDMDPDEKAKIIMDLERQMNPEKFTSEKIEDETNYLFDLDSIEYKKPATTTKSSTTASEKKSESD